MLKRVIRCFENQSYTNKQLIIVYEESDQLTCEFIMRYNFGLETKIIKVTSNPKLTLGELRNMSVFEAEGEYVCQWDDDDWFDPDRLSEQMKYLQQQGKLACILSRWIVFNIFTKKAYLSNKRLWEGSVLCKRDVMLQIPYPSLSKGEDSDVINWLYVHDELSVIDDQPHLYIYIYNGNNTWEFDHFKQIFDFSQELPTSFSKEVVQIITDSNN
ncbi:MAG: glycosyltransferase family 2 protein [Candidatus Azobacteroides sp.]|nr:glycosyltransferase family 2 protein [Candidatus Azobacteroides sp.]